MRKDYVGITSPEAAVDEATFVERYWAAKWKDRSAPPDTAAVASSEEYSVIRPYVDAFGPRTRILDGGCGLGEWTVFLAQRGFDAVGIDISEDVVAKLKAWFSGYQFERADLRRTAFSDESFDAYLSWGTFEHFEEGLGECLIEARRILRRGAWLFISVPFDNWRLILRDARPLERWDEQFDPETGYSGDHRFYQWRLTRAELRRELELRGFDVERITPIHKMTGVGRWLQWDLPVFTPGSPTYRIARRSLSYVLPASYISHMILAVARKR